MLRPATAAAVLLRPRVPRHARATCREHLRISLQTHLEASAAARDNPGPHAQLPPKRARLPGPDLQVPHYAAGSTTELPQRQFFALRQNPIPAYLRLTYFAVARSDFTLETRKL